MRRNSVKLTICIPTYNRSRYLQECLRSITDATSICGYEPEVIILDNASTDDTKIISQYFCQRYSYIRYHKNDKNIGAEGNFYNSITRAQGEYVWVFGDDDIFTAEALQAVLKNIDIGHDLIITNFSVWSSDLSLLKKTAFYKTNKSTTYNNANDLMRDLGIGLGYISSIVIRKQLFLQTSYIDYMSYSEYGFSYLYATYSAIASKCDAIFISEPLIKNRAGNSGNYDWYKYFVVGTALVLDRLSQKGYSRRSVSYAKQQVITRYVVFNIYTRLIEGESVRGLFGLMLPYYGKYLVFWLTCVPLLFFRPASLLRIARYAVRRIRLLSRVSPVSTYDESKA